MRKGDKRRQELVDTAAALFFERGYENTALNDILSNAGGSKGSFYHHFDSKMALLEEIARQRAASGFEAYAADSDAPPLASLNRLFYWACPFRYGEEGFLTSLIQLMRLKQSASLEQALSQGVDDLFYPAFLRAVSRVEDSPGTDEAERCLIWQSFLSACLYILRQAAENSPDVGRTRAVRLLRAMRLQLESSLFLPYGSLVIMEAEEMAQVLLSALERAGALA
ncbi:MAG: TetR/AcrR family transcriptional regulator [Eubacteriales bacterium]|nr:TetR/AcrR family transcriptional regulator [Eubacteriales bacterium]